MTAGSARVLVVDDNVDLAENIAEVLELAGIDVDVAEDGRAALECIGKQSYDLVLTDMRMPRMSGLELVRALEATAPEVPVLVMTAYAHDDKLDEVRTRGALEVLRKPVDLAHLTQLVGRLRPERIAVLVLEDDDQLRTNLTEALLAAERLFPFPAARAGAAKLISERAPPDVAIVDLRLPDESGLEVAERLAAGGVPVILATGFPGGAREREFAGVFVKPYNVAALIGRVREVAS